jgi:glycosyltransferase involved in cell wall biosynthesis
VTSAAAPQITVCIPTYKRANLLESAIRSVLDQSYEHVDILVGDDSPDDAARAVVERLQATTSVPIRYRHNVPKLGQPANVDRLFRDARGTHLLLLHDDDLLLPGAIAALIAPVRADARVRVVFGKQNFIRADGTPLPDETRKRNLQAGRDRARCAAERPLEACLLQDLPNDGYLIEADLARAIGYRFNDGLEVYVDAHFGIRVGESLKPGEMVFVEQFVVSYRRSPDAVSISASSKKIDHPVAAVALYRSLHALDLPPSSEYARQNLLRVVIDATVKGFALERQRSTALRLFLSRNYGWRKRLSPKGAYHLALIVSPRFDEIRRY